MRHFRQLPQSQLFLGQLSPVRTGRVRDQEAACPVQFHVCECERVLCVQRGMGTEGLPSPALRELSRGSINNCIIGTSLVAQWLRICLPMQGTRVRALVGEDPTRRGATKPMSHNY